MNVIVPGLEVAEQLQKAAPAGPVIVVVLVLVSLVASKYLPPAVLPLIKLAKELPTESESSDPELLTLLVKVPCELPSYDTVYVVWAPEAALPGDRVQVVESIPDKLKVGGVAVFCPADPSQVKVWQIEAPDEFWLPLLKFQMYLLGVLHEVLKLLIQPAAKPASI